MNVVELRGLLGWTQHQLAQMLGLHYMTVSNWERRNLKPTPHQAALMRSFQMAHNSDPDIGEKAVAELTSCGVSCALYCLLSAAHREDL